eukprot:3674495-Pleurochrysis_carterae.AAC.2
MAVNELGIACNPSVDCSFANSRILSADRMRHTGTGSAEEHEVSMRTCSQNGVGENANLPMECRHNMVKCKSIGRAQV